MVFKRKKPLSLGRPPKYCQELVDKAKDYVSNYKSYSEPIPTVEGLADALDVHVSTVNDWCSKFEDFSAIVGRIAQVQKKRLFSGGLLSKFNPTITKLILSANHQVNEKIVTEEVGNADEIVINFGDSPRKKKVKKKPSGRKLVKTDEEK
jgi:hypothetical protein